MKIYKVKSVGSDGETYKDRYNYNFREIEDPENFNIYDDSVSVDLDSCPFCGVNGILNLDSMGYFGWCSICGTEGPHHHEWWRAAKMWNARNDIKTIMECKNVSDYKHYRDMDFNRFTDETRKFMTERCFTDES